MTLTTEYVHYMPKEKKEGILYVSKEFELCIHICPCGCKTEAVTPFRIWVNPETGYRHGWDMTDNNGIITLSPSLLNSGCNAHYHLVENEIRWC